MMDLYGTPGSYRPNHPGQSSHSYLIKLNNNGQVLWSTYLESAANSPSSYFPMAVTTDAQNNIIVVGFAGGTGMETFSGTFKTQPHFSGYNSVVLKFAPTGSFLWGSYYGTVASSLIDVTCDTIGNIYFAGYTLLNDTSITTPGVPYPQLRSDTVPESFLAKFTPQGQRIWGTYTGGLGLISGLKYNNKNGIYLLALTRHSSGIATTGVHQQQYGGGSTDYCLSQWNATTAEKQWATYYGGTGRERNAFPTNDNDVASPGSNLPKKALTIDSEGNILITGQTFSANNIEFGCSNREHDTLWNGLGFIAKFYDDGHIRWGSRFSIGLATVVAGSEKAFYVGAPTNVSGLHTIGAFQSSLIGNFSGYFSKMVDNYTCPKVTESITQSGTTLLVNNTYNRYQWYFNGAPIALANIAQTPLTTDTGYYYVRFSDTCNCRYYSDTFYYPKTTTIIPNTANKQNIQLYPNPADQTITLTGTMPLAAKTISFKIVNINGQVLFQKQIDNGNKNTFTYTIESIADLPAGIYTILIQSHNTIETLRFVKR